MFVYNLFLVRLINCHQIDKTRKFKQVKHRSIMQERNTHKLRSL